MINEDGYSMTDVQDAGQWASMGAVRKYAKVETNRVKTLLERKVVLGSFREFSQTKDAEITDKK